MAFRMGRAHEGWSMADWLLREKQIYPRSSTKPDRQKILTFCSATPGRRLLATVAPPSGLPTNCSALFSTLLWVSHESQHSPSCSPVLTCLGTWWEIKSPPLQKDKKHPLGACLGHAIGSPLQKEKKRKETSLGHIFGATQSALLTCFNPNVLF